MKTHYRLKLSAAAVATALVLASCSSASSLNDAGATTETPATGTGQGSAAVDTGVTTPQMLWDPTFFTWQQLGITAQPTWILVDSNGEQLGTWVGALPTEQIPARV